MSILVITSQPARMRRVATGIDDDLVFDTEGEAIRPSAGAPWRLVLIDEEIGSKSIDLVAEAVRAGNRVMLYTREPSLLTTMRAIRAGAYDVVTLPLDAERIRGALRPIRAHKRSWEQAVVRTSSHEWVGPSPTTLDAFRLASRAAAGDMHVLVVGESGVGKELLARIIHESYARHRNFIGLSSFIWSVQRGRIRQHTSFPDKYSGRCQLVRRSVLRAVRKLKA